MNRNLSLTKLLFEEENTEGRLKLREKLPNSSLMSNSIISHNDIQNIICPKIAKSIQGEAKIKKAMTFYAKLESAMKKSKETDINKLYSKMNEKAQKEFDKHLEVAKTNLGYLDQQIIQRLFLKNTSMGKAGKTHINPVQMKPGADQVEGAYEVDLQIYEDLQVVTFFMSNIDSETLTNFGSQGKHLVMYLAPGSCMFVKKENVELFNEAFISDPNYKITSDDQIFWAYEKVAFVYIKPEEIPKLQANPRKEIMRLLSLVGSRKGNKTNIEADDEDQKLDREGDEDRPESSGEKKDQESVKLNSQKDTSSGGEKEVKEESYVYRRGITSLLAESQAAGRTIAINYQSQSVGGSFPGIALTSAEESEIDNYSDQITQYALGKFDDIKSVSGERLKRGIAAVGTGAAIFTAGIGLTAAPVALPIALGTWIATDSKGYVGKFIDRIRKDNKEQSKNDNSDSLKQVIKTNIIDIVKNIKASQERGAEDTDNLKKEDVIEVSLKNDNLEDIIRQIKSFQFSYKNQTVNIEDAINDANDRGFLIKFFDTLTDADEKISSPREFLRDFESSIIKKVNCVLLRFNGAIENVPRQSVGEAFTNDAVNQIIARKKREELIIQKFKDEEIENKKKDYEARTSAGEDTGENTNPPPFMPEIDDYIEALNKARNRLKYYKNYLSRGDSDLSQLLKALGLKENNSVIGNLLLEDKKEKKISKKEVKVILQYLTSKKLETFLNAVDAINNSGDDELFKTMFTYIHSEPNDFAKTFDSLRNEKSDLNKALSKLGDLNKIKKLLKQKERKASSKQKKRKEKEDKIKKAAGKKLGVKTESVDLRKEWLRLWDI